MSGLELLPEREKESFNRVACLRTVKGSTPSLLPTSLRHREESLQSSFNFASQTGPDLKPLSNRGKLELILADLELVASLKERWIAAEVAKRLDYPIFMAVSEHSGKNNSGEYEYVVDTETGSLIEFPEGHPQEGQLVVDQDLINYDLTLSDLANVATIPEDKLRIAESFVKFAREQNFDFWEAE